jgi:hypothetical protein
VTITATLGSSIVSQTLTVNLPAISNFAILPATVTGPATAVGTVTLAAAAGPSGDVVTITNGDTTDCTTPTTVTVPAGQTTATFNIAANSVGHTVTVTVTVTLDTSSQNDTLKIK